jgi:hypothetical protein
MHERYCSPQDWGRCPISFISASGHQEWRRLSRMHVASASDHDGGISVIEEDSPWLVRASSLWKAGGLDPMPKAKAKKGKRSLDRARSGNNNGGELTSSDTTSSSRLSLCGS